MSCLSLEQIWKSKDGNKELKVRFNDWSHQIKYFTIQAESSDGKRFIGTLDSGEKITYAKKSKGWSIYYPEAEHMAKAV